MMQTHDHKRFYFYLFLLCLIFKRNANPWMVSIGTNRKIFHLVSSNALMSPVLKGFYGDELVAERCEALKAHS